jgi:hypothetical protein
MALVIFLEKTHLVKFITSLQGIKQTWKLSACSTVWPPVSLLPLSFSSIKTGAAVLMQNGEETWLPFAFTDVSEG